MADSIDMHKQIENAVLQFVRDYMSVQPTEITVDVHDSHVLVTLRQVTCPAEREYARERSSRDLLEKLFSDTFDAVKVELERAIEQIAGRAVQRSRLTVDPPTGDAILTLFIES